MMTYTYHTKGVCAQAMVIEVEDGILKNFAAVGGCNGNLQGIGALVKGLKVEEVIARLEGIRCGGKATSCPDQLAKALKSMPKEG